ncbi:MAG: hypothetical protein JW776_15270 [Candidatus Lokiarchaeota archaeon]|nr:hypothetical protein [Candidatus Lokiarchaeota archaeon]
MLSETKFRREIRDFFDFIIWDSISQIILESAGNVEQKKIKSMQKNLCALFVDSILQNYSHGVFKSKFVKIIQESGFVNELMEEYIMETLSLFRLRLFNIFSREQIKNTSLIPQEQYLELEGSIENYVILSYLDKFILSNVVKILLYSSRISFAEVNEFRIRLIEIFREILDGTATLKELTEYLESELDKMVLEKITRDFVSASVIGYFTTITRFDNFLEILEQMKKRIKNKIPIYSDTSFIQKNRIDNILLWITQEVVEPFFDMINGSNIQMVPETEELISAIKKIYRKQLERKFNLDMVLSRLKTLEESIEITQRSQGKNHFNFSSKSSYFPNKFRVLRKDSNTSRGVLTTESFFKTETDLQEDIKLTPKRVIEMEFQILLYLATYLDSELSFDYQLDSFYNLIRQSRNGTDQIYL